MLRQSHPVAGATALAAFACTLVAVVLIWSVPRDCPFHAPSGNVTEQLICAGVTASS